MRIYVIEMIKVDNPTSRYLLCSYSNKNLAEKVGSDQQALLNNTYTYNISEIDLDENI